MPSFTTSGRPEYPDMAPQSTFVAMRVYISVDMEGIAGVVHEDQTNPTDPRCAAE
ncbi:MAG: M55 family metallopeptidase, partial [Gemmatimonadales bacterium]